jgi:hypothetical protein
MMGWLPIQEVLKGHCLYNERVRRVALALSAVHLA